jgi:hypothetical protein
MSMHSCNSAATSELRLTDEAWLERRQAAVAEIYRRLPQPLHHQNECESQAGYGDTRTRAVSLQVLLRNVDVSPLDAALAYMGCMRVRCGPVLSPRGLFRICERSRRRSNKGRARKDAALSIPNHGRSRAGLRKTGSDVSGRLDTPRVSNLS